MSDRLLIIFSKNPVAGRVKTRLASSIGDPEALRVYETLRGLTEKATSAADAEKAIFYSDFIPETDLFLTGNVTAHLQDGGDLGKRMHRAFLKGFELGFHRVVLIGTDCPELSTFLIDRAFQCLTEDDMVMGPARDGGFYLVGLTRPFPELFLDRTWSTPEVLNDSLRIAREHHSGCTLLPALSDIDTIDDLLNSGLWDSPN